MARMHADSSKWNRLATLLATAGVATLFALALPTSAHAWNTGPSGGGHGGGGWHGGGGGWHGGSMPMHSHDSHSHDGHDHSFSSFSLALGFSNYSAPAYYPYPAYPVYYAPPPVVVVPQGAPCQQGRWRQADGSVVSGVACLGSDGNWRLAN